MNVIQEINNFNDKFATQGGKLKIEKRGEKLNIRGSLPTKENKNNYKVQRISLGLNADLPGLEAAKKKLQLINLQLELDQFDWINWTNILIKKCQMRILNFYQKSINSKNSFLKITKMNILQVQEKQLGGVLTNPTLIE